MVILILLQGSFFFLFLKTGSGCGETEWAGLLQDSGRRKKKDFQEVQELTVAPCVEDSGWKLVN